MTDKRTQIAIRIAALQRELAQLETRPEEPGGSSPVVAFTIEFSSGLYSYAARKAHGRWWPTGATRSKSHTWDELLDWIDESHVGGLAASNLTLLRADVVLV